MEHKVSRQTIKELKYKTWDVKQSQDASDQKKLRIVQ